VISIQLLTKSQKILGLLKIYIRCFKKSESHGIFIMLIILKMKTSYSPGDFIVTHGSDFFDGLIQIFTHSQWDHAALIINDKGDIIELTNSGIKKSSINKYSAQQKYIVHIDMSDDDRKEVLAYANYMLEKHESYGFLTIVSISLKILTKLRLVIKLDGTLICSEFVALALAEGGIIWPMDTALITPADLFNFFQNKKNFLQGRVHTRIV
jgi:hypothetical protein